MTLVPKNGVYVECQMSKKWEAIKQRYLDAPILITIKWEMEFHVHTYASNLAIGL
jgi:hypothetical protein